jgi:hypothetical protein
MEESYKGKAIRLRKKGKTYAEILQEVPVAKSTLSVWFRNVQLSAPQVQLISAKKRASAGRGAAAQKKKRLRQTQALLTQGIEDVGKLSGRELWLIGVALYWAEGSKQRVSSVSTGLLFSNSDPAMLKVFLSWLRLLKVPDRDRVFELYVHTSRKDDVQEFQGWWERALDLPKGSFSRVYYKKGSVLTNRQNVADLYHGLIRIRVRASTSLNRQVQGWVEGIASQ